MRLRSGHIVGEMKSERKTLPIKKLEHKVSEVLPINIPMLPINIIRDLKAYLMSVEQCPTKIEKIGKVVELMKYSHKHFSDIAMYTQLIETLYKKCIELHNSDFSNIDDKYSDIVKDYKEQLSIVQNDCKNVLGL